MTGKIKNGVGRRRVLKGAAGIAGAALGSGAVTGFPTIWAQNNKNIVLRQCGTGVSAINEIAEKCKADLGITLQMTALDSDAVVQRVVTQPNSFDIGDIEYWMIKKVFPANTLQAMDVKKIKLFDKIVPIFTTGKLKADSVIAQGTAPSTVSFVEGAGSTKFAKGQTQWFTAVPTIYNADTLGIRPDLVGGRDKITSWKDLLDPKFKGKTALVDYAPVGVIDVAMALEARGDFKYGDKGNMTKEEIDKTIKIMIDLKKAGQFRSFWSTFDQSVNLMASGEVVIQSMWSPAVTAVRSRGIDCYYVPLKEGYRGWTVGLAPMAHLSGLKLDCAYAYMNWFNSGWQGGFIAKQGYYSAVPSTAKKFLTPEEWDYWYEGKPAAVDIKDPYGALMEKKGTSRDGGGIWDRMGNIACWNTVMDEDRYLTRRWNEFVSS